MKMQAKQYSDRLATIAGSLPEESVTTIEALPCVGKMTTINAFLAFRGSEDKEFPNRPYLHFVGECKEIAGSLPFGINKINFPVKEGIPVDFFYEFTNEQIADLANKGLFEKDFKTPTILRNNQTGIEVPIYCNFRVVHPLDEQDYPVVFAEIIGQHEIVMDERTSGYTMSNYFEHISKDNPYDYDLFDEEEKEIDEIIVQPAVEAIIEEERELTEEEQLLMGRLKNIEDRVIEDHIKTANAMERTLGLETAPKKALEIPDYVKEPKKVAEKTSEFTASDEMEIDAMGSFSKGVADEVVEKAPVKEAEDDGFVDDFEIDETKDEPAEKIEDKTLDETLVEAELTEDAVSSDETLEDKRAKEAARRARIADLNEDLNREDDLPRPDEKPADVSPVVIEPKPKLREVPTAMKDIADEYDKEKDAEKDRHYGEE